MVLMTEYIWVTWWEVVDSGDRWDIVFHTEQEMLDWVASFEDNGNIVLGRIYKYQRISEVVT